MYDFHELQRFSQEQDRGHSGGLWTDAFVQRHHLQGFAYRRTGAHRFYDDWKRQLSRNFIVRDCLSKIGASLAAEDIQVCLLKGFSLMGDIYEDWGERFASDVDLLVSVESLWRVSDILKLHGFEKAYEKKWMGNRFKFLFNKKVSGVDVCVEVHTQLFWHQEMDVFEGVRPAPIEGFYALALEKQLVHLCGHLAFQHTYLKLFWLMDIYQFILRYKESLDWKAFWVFAEVGGLYKSCFLSLQICERLGLDIGGTLAVAPKRYQWTLKLLNRLTSLQFLYDPRRKRIRYFLVKNLVKDKLTLNVIYTFKWFQRKRV